MNSYSVLHEISDLICDFSADSKNIHWLKSTCEEALDIILADSEFLEFHKSKGVLLCEMLKGVKNDKESTPSEEKINKLSQLVSVFKRSEQDFICNLLDRLLLSLTDEIDIEGQGKERKLSQIYSLTSEAISCLLSVGYSPTYLYNRAELLTYPARYKGRSLHDQLTFFIERLKKPDAKYTAIQPVTFNSMYQIPDSIGDVKVLVESPTKLDEGELTKLGVNGGAQDGYEIRYLVKEILAKDYVSAAWKMQGHIGMVRDIVTFEYKQNIFNYISPKCLVSFTDPVIHKHVVRIELLSSLLLSRSDAYQYQSMIEVLNCAMQLDDESSGVKESINRIIRYHRLGIETSSLEQKFLSIWIVLEAIVEGGDGNIIDNIVSVVPELYAFDTLRKRLQYLHELLKKNNVQLPQDIPDGVDIGIHYTDESRDLMVVYEMVSKEEEAEKIFNELDNKEFVKFILKRMHKEFASKKTIQARIEKTKNDVSRQIRRIYYLRNKIVHRAHHGDLSLRLLSHLYDYVEYIMCDFLMALHGETGVSNFSEIANGYLMAMEQKKLEWKEKSSLLFDDIYFLTAIL